MGLLIMGISVYLCEKISKIKLQNTNKCARGRIRLWRDFNFKKFEFQNQLILISKMSDAFGHWKLNFEIYLLFEICFLEFLE